MEFVYNLFRIIKCNFRGGLAKWGDFTGELGPVFETQVHPFESHSDITTSSDDL